MQYRVHGIGRQLGTEISATIHASSREDAQRLAEATMVVSAIDEPEDPLDIAPVDVNETPNVGAIDYDTPLAASLAQPAYVGIVHGAATARYLSFVCGFAAFISTGISFDRRGEPFYLFSALGWVVVAVGLHLIAQVALAVREIAINSRGVRRES